jgi:hypothetical protein
MKKQYSTPDLQIHGSVHRITEMFGSQQVQDVFVNPAGQVIETGTGSIDACPTRDHPPVMGSDCFYY